MRLISQNGIADIVVMRSLYVIEEYHVFELHGVADNAVSAYERTAADECAVAYLGAVIYDAGSPYIGGGEDLCVLRNPDILEIAESACQGYSQAESSSPARVLVRSSRSLVLYMAFLSASDGKP